MSGSIKSFVLSSICFLIVSPASLLADYDYNYVPPDDPPEYNYDYEDYTTYVDPTMDDNMEEPEVPNYEHGVPAPGSEGGPPLCDDIYCTEYSWVEPLEGNFCTLVTEHVCFEYCGGLLPVYPLPNRHWEERNVFNCAPGPYDELADTTMDDIDAEIELYAEEYADMMDDIS
jgi:hypothetical protein